MKKWGLIIFGMFMAATALAAVLATADCAGTSNPIGGAWTTVTSVNAIQTVSGVCRATVTSDVNAVYHSTVPPDDQYSQVTLTTVSAGDGGPILRIATGAYSLYACGANTSTGIDLFKIVTGSYTSLNSDTISFAGSDVIKATAQSTTIKCFQNAVEIASTTDATLTSGRFGFYISPGGSLTNFEVDNFEGGNFLASATAVTRRRNQ